MTANEIYRLALFHLRDEEGSDSTRALPSLQAITFLNEAINEACRRGNLLIDRSTAAICQISIVAGTASYTLDSRIVKVKRARLVTADTVLERLYTADMDRCNSGWEDETGTPYGYLTDYETGKITVYPIPTANDTMKLVVKRLPLTPLSDLSDTPEINERFHPALAAYLVWRTRSIDDSENYDPKKAQAAIAEFELEFGPKRSAWAETYEEAQPYPEYE